MKKQQQGSAHIVIMIVLILSLITALGWIFWQNFVYKPPEAKKEVAVPATSNKIESDTDTPKPSYKTFTLSKQGLSFQYPTDWSVNVKSDDVDVNTGKRIEIIITDETGKSVAALQTGAQLGGLCEKTREFQTLEADIIAIGKPPVAFGLTALANEYGSYSVHYGLTGTYTSKKTGQVCSNTFYYTFDSGKDAWGGTSFGNDMIKVEDFRSIDEVRAFLASDKYSKLKKMIT